MYYPKCERDYKMYLGYDKTKNQNAVNINDDNKNDDSSNALLDDNNDGNNNNQQSMQNLNYLRLTSFSDSLSLMNQRMKRIEYGNNNHFSAVVI